MNRIHCFWSTLTQCFRLVRRVYRIRRHYRINILCFFHGHYSNENQPVYPRPSIFHIHEPKYASRHVWIDEYRIPCRSRGDHKHFRYWWFCGTRNRSCVILYPVIVTSWEANNWQEYQKYLKTKNYRYTSL